MRLADHPTVKAFQAPAATPTLDADWLRALCLEAGADDVGFVAVDSVPEQHDDIVALLPSTKTLISFVVRMGRDDIRAPARSVANLQFHHTTDRVNDVAHRIGRALEPHRVRAVTPAAGFPMEMDRFPGKVWVLSHKPIAVAAGLGQIGIHRNVIHPKFGNFIILGTVLIDAAISAHSAPIDFNPCLECKLCVAACPVGAISDDGAFNFAACATHNYREFLGGFGDWVGQVADSKDAKAYRAKVTDSETASMWQSLSFGANYKAAYCMAVCPAGEDVIAPFLLARKQFTDEVLRPLQRKEETVYVLANSDAAIHVKEKFPHKRIKVVKSGLGAKTIAAFLFVLPSVFQRRASKGLDAVYHFVFTGAETQSATVVIRQQTLTVTAGLVGESSLVITADAATWLGFLAKERNIVWALVTRRIRLRGPLRLLRAFGRCFA